MIRTSPVHSPFPRRVWEWPSQPPVSAISALRSPSLSTLRSCRGGSAWCRNGKQTPKYFCDRLHFLRGGRFFFVFNIDLPGVAKWIQSLGSKNRIGIYTYRTHPPQSGCVCLWTILFWFAIHHPRSQYCILYTCCCIFTRRDSSPSCNHHRQVPPLPLPMAVGRPKILWPLPLSLRPWITGNAPEGAPPRTALSDLFTSFYLCFSPSDHEAFVCFRNHTLLLESLSWLFGFPYGNE